MTALTREAYASGSYEVTNSAVVAGSGEMLAEAGIRLLREMARERFEAGAVTRVPQK